MFAIMEKKAPLRRSDGESLRRLVIEVSLEQFGNSGQTVPVTTVNLLAKIKSIEMLHILKMVPGEFAAIARIELRDSKFNVEAIWALEGLQGSKLEHELLDRESDTVFTYFIRSKTSVRRPELVGQGGSMPYLSTPFELKDGKLRITLLGSSSQVKRYLNDLSKQTLVKYRIASLTDARFPPNSPMGRLTDKQRRVLVTAYRLGYYDVPRRITSEELAKNLNLVKSTFSAHVRKAERRLLAELLSEL